MVLERTLLKEIEDSKRWLDIEKDVVFTKEILPKKNELFQSYLRIRILCYKSNLKHYDSVDDIS
jgi:hypothetical protein